MSADGAAGSSGGGAEDLSGDEQRGPVVASAVSGGGCLVFEPADVLRLRAEHRLVGRLVGSVPPSRRPKKKRRQGHDPEPIRQYQLFRKISLRAWAVIFEGKICFSKLLFSFFFGRTLIPECVY